jgi:hypothetical protein
MPLIPLLKKGELKQYSSCGKHEVKYTLLGKGELKRVNTGADNLL